MRTINLHHYIDFLWSINTYNIITLRPLTKNSLKCLWDYSF